MGKSDVAVFASAAGGLSHYAAYLYKPFKV